MNHVQSLKADIANLSVKVLMKAEHRHTWTGKNKSIRFETCLMLNTNNKLIEPHCVKGTINGGVDVNETYISILSQATNRCAEFLKFSSKKTKTVQKSVEDMYAIHRIIWKIADDDIISEIILRTCDVIEKDRTFTVKEMLKVVDLLKMRASQHVSNLFKEDAK